MTQRGNEIMTQVIISVFVSICMFISFFMIDVVCISDVFDDFRRNNYQAILDLGEFLHWSLHYFIIGGLIGFFGIYMHNFVTNILGIIRSALVLPHVMRNVTFYQAYFSTTFEGKLFFVELVGSILILIISLIGLFMACRKVYTGHKEKLA